MKIVMATGTFDIVHPGHGLFLKEAKKLGGENARLVVVLARDSTVRSKKRIPIINEEQRLEMIKLLKPVDEAFLGSETDMFAVVKKINPDIIAIGPDQKFDIENLKEDLKNRGLECEVKRVNKYKKSHLDSSCKIIKRIKEIEFDESAFKNC
ncbi:MAG: adenylyltransferase/cytidyltransferase family protein [Methanobacteriaceae archaeon]|nr:adenylyltransferase/cytidyltransferase family protein [Methanobacteriaceae archaeon]MDZ4171378.1 adenylyltransferase/cytidyltransferase family protein [Methanobacteriaceae archaeon]